MSTSFRNDDNWCGGFYELVLELGERDDGKLERAIAAISAAAHVDGWFGRQDVEPQHQHRLHGTLAELLEHGHLRGIVQLPEGARVVCGLVAVRLDSGTDCLDFYLPHGALGRADKRVGAFPFGPPDERGASLVWRRPIDDWLADVAREVYGHARFRLGMIGDEVSGATSAEELGGHVPDERWVAYLLPTGDELRYYPATQ